MQTLNSISNTDNQSTPFNLSTPQVLLSTLKEICQTFETRGEVTFNQW